MGGTEAGVWGGVLQGVLAGGGGCAWGGGVRQDGRLRQHMCRHLHRVPGCRGGRRVSHSATMQPAGGPTVVLPVSASYHRPPPLWLQTSLLCLLHGLVA